MWLVYILLCKDGSLYTGITNNIAKRLQTHKMGKGGGYTKAHGAKRIVYIEETADRSAALKREAEIKKMPRSKKLQLL